MLYGWDLGEAMLSRRGVSRRAIDWLPSELSSQPGRGLLREGKELSSRPGSSPIPGGKGTAGG